MALPLLILLAPLLLLVPGHPSPALGAGKSTIKLYDGQWDSLRLNNAIAAFVIRHGYGLSVEAVVMTGAEMESALTKGEIHLSLEDWRQSRLQWYEEQTARGTIVDLGVTFEGSPQFWVIPRSAAETHGIRSVADMLRFWEIFRDPDDPTRGRFHNCIRGWHCAAVNEVKLEGYGLAPYFNPVSPGTPEALEEALAAAQERGRPVFGYYWAPTPLMGAYDWQVLEEPPFNEACWKAVTAASRDAGLLPLRQACAYPDWPIHKIAHRSLLKKAPEVVRMLRDMLVGLEPLNQTLAWAKKQKSDDWNRAARLYLERYPERWHKWVPPGAQERIVKALADQAE